jgi:hypothetical protein
MRAGEARQLIGSQVSAWTSSNGAYVGVLQEVTGSPWRGMVRITGVLEPATPFDATRNTQRRGFRPGDVIEVGGINIAACAAPGLSYLDALKASLALMKSLLPQATDRTRWAIEAHAKELEKRIQEEAATQSPTTDA